MILLFCLAFAADPAITTQSSLFDEGVQAALEGRTEAAQAAWLRIKRSGLANADVEYNLGTSYAESNELGLAILHLKRASLLRPSKDASGNLHVVRERVLEANPGHTRELSLLGDVADQLVRIPFVELFGVALILCSLLVGLQYAFLRRRPWAVALGIAVSAALGISAGVGALIEVVYHDWKPPAVVLKRTAAKSGPDERFKTVMELGAGEEVRLTGKEAALGFVAIELASGETAFVSEQSVVKVKDWR